MGDGRSTVSCLASKEMHTWKPAGQAIRLQHKARSGAGAVVGTSGVCAHLRTPSLVHSTLINIYNQIERHQCVIRTQKTVPEEFS